MTERERMSPIHIVFIVLSIVTLGAAIAVVTLRNLLRSALFMILAFFGVAGLYILLEAEFLAVIQVLVYIGAIAILIIFAVMLTRRDAGRWAARFNQQWWLVALAVLPLFGALVYTLWRVNWQVTTASPPAEIIPLLGQELVTTYVLPFEVASVLLLAALVGAIVIARER